jgi:hypothetical protein
MRRRSLSALTSEKSSSPSGRIAFQHWVSKFLVKNFADRDGRVFCLDIYTDQFTKPTPRQAASEKDFNDFKVYGEATTSPVSDDGRSTKRQTKEPVLEFRRPTLLGI